MSSLRPHGPPCPAPVRPLVEHKRNVVEIDPPLSTQLEGRFHSSKTISPRRADVLTRPACFSPENHPPRRRGYQRTCYSIPPTQRQWRKRDHGSFKRKPPETEGYPKVFYPRDPITAQIQRPVVSYLPIISTGLSFLFRSPEPLFLLQAKEKVVLAPAGQAEKQSPAGQAKNQLQDKNIPLFPQKKKRFSP